MIDKITTSQEAVVSEVVSKSGEKAPLNIIIAAPK